MKARSAALNALHGMVVTAPAELRSAIVMAEGEVKELDAALSQLVRRAAPRTIALRAIGVDHAGQFLITAGERPERLRSEAAFAHLCGAAPIPARADARGAIVFTAAATAPPTVPCIWPSSCGYAAARALVATWNGAPLRVSPNPRSGAA